MPNYDYTNGATSGNLHSGHKLSVVERVLDFAQIAIDRAAAGLTALAAADVIQLIGVAAGQHVLVVYADVERVEGEACTFEIGDGTDPNGFLDAVNGNSVAKSASLVTTPFSVAVGGGKRYAAADTIDMQLNTVAFNVGKVRVFAVILDLRSDQS